MRLPTLSLSLLAFSVPLSQVSAGPTNSVLNENVAAFINQILKDYKSPGGVGVAVVRKDAQGNWIRETKGYGIATLANGNPVTKDTLFAIGSNSKLFDILSVGLLTHNGTLSPRLSWNTKLASVIPGFGLEDSVALKHATIIDAMSHRTGLPRHDISARLYDTITSVISKVANQRPSAEFREVFQYNSYMYTILSSLPTTLLQDKPSFPQYVKQHILDPLGMTSTTYSSRIALTSGRLADGMGRQLLNTGGAPVIFRALPFCLAGMGEDGAFLGPGGVISSPEDMATWLQMLLLNGRHPTTNVTIIPADVITTVANGITIEKDFAFFPELSPVVYGGGQEHGTYRGYEWIGHSGSVSGFASFTIRFPWNNIGIAVLSNDQELGVILGQVIQYRLVDEALGLTPIDWETRFNNLFPPDVVVPTTPRPAHALFPPGKFSQVAGIYNNAGYGPIELCLVSPRDPHASRSCNVLMDNLSKILPGSTQSDIPTFIVPWTTVGLSHVRLTHFDGYLFNVTGFASFRTGNDTVPYWTYDVGAVDVYAEVDEELSGLGFYGIWGAGAGVPPPGGNTPQERAEVWFDRV